MQKQENKATIRRLVEEVNKGSVPWGLFAPNCLFHTDDPRQPRYDLPEFKEFIKDLLVAFPDYHLTVEDLIMEQDKVVALYRESGTMRGRFLNWAPTNKKYTQPAIEIYRIYNGKIVEIWMSRNQLAILSQLGLEPTVATT